MRKTRALFLIVLFVNFQFLNVVVNSSAIFEVKNQETLEPYRWLWEELSNAPGPISGEDVVYWGENLGPYHNYTELTEKLVLLNSTFPEIVDVFINNIDEFLKIREYINSEEKKLLVDFSWSEYLLVAWVADCGVRRAPTIQ